jgi:hypothetical protein
MMNYEKERRRVSHASSFIIPTSELISMTFIGSDNAIAWAQFRLRGGWRQSLKVAAGFFILASIGAFFMVRADPIHSGRTLWGWASGMLALNAGILVLYTSSRIGTAVKQDFTTKMIESHRLMPIPATHVIAGYIVGGAMQPLILAFAVFLFGGMCAIGADVDAERWIMANLVLLVFSLFGWVLAVFMGFQKKGMNALAILPVLFPSIPSGRLFLAPGVLVLLSPIIGQSVFKLTATATEFPWIYIVCFVAQAYFGAICFVGAARRYRDPSAIGLTPILGFLIVLGWIVITWVAMARWEDLRPTVFGRMPQQLPEMQAAISMLIALFLALLPTSAAARLATEAWKRRSDVVVQRRASTLVHAVTFLAAGLSPLLIPIQSPQLPMPSRSMILQLALVLAMCAIGFYFLFRIFYRFFEGAFGLSFVWLLMTWGLPIGVDLVRYSMSNQPIEPMGAASAASPGGAIIMLLSHNRTPLLPGLIVQFVMMLIPIVLFSLLKVAGERKQETGFPNSVPS